MTETKCLIALLALACIIYIRIICKPDTYNINAQCIRGVYRLQNGVYTRKVSLWRTGAPKP